MDIIWAVGTAMVGFFGKRAAEVIINKALENAEREGMIRSAVVEVDGAMVRAGVVNPGVIQCVFMFPWIILNAPAYYLLGGHANDVRVAAIQRF